MSYKGNQKVCTGVMRALFDARGSIMPMTAIAMVTLAGVVGGGVDVSRAYMVQNRLQNACDSAVLAGRRAIRDNGFDAAAKKQADDYFDTNFDEANEDVSNTSFVPLSAESDNRVNGTASTRMNTLVMGLFGFNSINLSVTCSASMSVGNSDIMMVLDTTGSMDRTISGYSTSDESVKRITYLKNAMKDFYDTVKSASNGTNARVRYGFVPYSSGVNVGELIYDLNPNYLVDSWTYQSRQALYTTEEQDTFVGWEPPVYSNGTSYSDIDYGSWRFYSGTRYRSSRQCRDALPSDTDWSNHGSPTTNNDQYINSSGQRVTTETVSQAQRRTNYECYRSSRRRYYIIYRTEERSYDQTEYATEDPIYSTTTVSVFDKWVYKPVTYNTSAFKTFSSVNIPLGTDGANISSTWAGCIQERDTVSDDTFGYSSITGISPSGALDLDIDTAPDSGDDDTKWRPLWDDVGYYRTTDSSNRYYSSDTESDYGRKARSYCPVKAQLLTEMTESEFDAYADSLVPRGSTYHDIGMIWGARLSSPSGIFQSNVTETPANGGAIARHIIFMTDGQMSTSSGLQTAYGIEWHDRRVTNNGSSDQNARHSARFLAVCQAAKAKGIRVWVIAFGSVLTTNLENCASTDSAFTAGNASQLNAAFQEIAKNVGELRVIQ